MRPKTERTVEALLKEKKIFEIVNPRLVQATPEISLASAMALMKEKKSGYIVVAENKKAVGIFTETDVVLKILGRDVDEKRSIVEFMTADPPTLSLQDSVGRAIDVMGERRFYHIPLVDEKGDLVNVISVRTLIRFLAEFYPTEIYNLPPKPGQIMLTQEGG
ncbi:MAG: CBS domain-containing protein [Chlamydiae bacterium]|nr:CBS domain-containing protein [Chlamydiota bacterium]MBI3277058.1 CBS domain-containing protein [Chlamydiota bacterium]